MTILTIAELTQNTLEGTGIFDVLMRANKVHLEAEFNKGRIKGTEYATVYLGSLETVMKSSMDFLLQRQRIDLEAQLLVQQVLLAETSVLKATAELAILNANLAKIPLELAQITAQTNLVNAQITKSAAELAIVQATALKIPAEIAQLKAQTDLTEKQIVSATLKDLNTPKEGAVLDAQTCKLKAEFDLLQSEKIKSAAEIALLTQKNATEKAQITNLGVDENSVVGRQKLLYEAQTAGFSRDAEQKAAKIMVDTWNVRKTTDDTTPAIITDANIVSTITKMMNGVGAAVST